MIRSRVLLVLIAILSLNGAVTAGGQTDQRQSSGVVEGTVSYEPDADRPWRFARYYVNKQKGQLAEAVVALVDKSLEQDDERRPATATMDQRDFRFIPETIAIQAGDSVQFLNNDGTVHNVQTLHPLQSFNVSITAGGKHVVKLEKATSIQRPYTLGCAFHSSMRAWIYVFDHRYFQVTGKDGTFRFENVPPGEYELAVIHPAGELSRREAIVVAQGKAAALDIRLSPDDKK